MSGVSIAQVLSMAATAQNILTTVGKSIQARGVNLAGADFGTVFPGTPGADYFFPTLAELAYYAGKGMNVFRLPFLWERIQPVLGGPLDAAHVAWLTSFLTTYPNVSFVLDVHNYNARNGIQLGASGGPTTAQLAALWGALATQFMVYPNAVFGMMNEPGAANPQTWLATANAAIAAIRATGATNLIMVPGIYSTGAAHFVALQGAVMLGVVDPANNYVYEVHQYADATGSGTSSTAVSGTIIADNLVSVTNWAITNGKRLFLGEFGVANNPTMLSALTTAVAYMAANPGTWWGWTYWAGGPAWDNYMYSIEPTDLGQPAQTDSAQITALQPYL